MVDTLPLFHMERVPTAPSRRKAWFVAAGSWLPGAFAAWWMRAFPTWYAGMLADNPEAAAVLGASGLGLPLEAAGLSVGVAGVALGMLGLVALVPHPYALRMLRGGFRSVYLLGGFALGVAFVALMRILGADVPFLGHPAQDPAIMLQVWFGLAWPVLLGMAWTGVLHILSHTRAVVAVYARDANPAPLPGDYLLEDLRTHGRDPRLRKSAYASAGLHLFVLVGLPLLARMGGCIEPYRVPYGSGDPVVAFVQVVQPKPRTEQRLALNPDSAIYYHVPDLDESDVERQVEEDTQLTYDAHAEAQAGAIGKGGGDTGGWPEGMRDGEIRFIRLQHNGRGWDDGMGRHAADRNFLAEVRRVTGLPTRRDGESIRVADLARYPADAFPPFVFLTGTASFRIHGSDERILREYLLQGGMLFVTGGSRDFDRSFRALMRTMFPGNPMVDIPDDDVLFQQPFRFPHGPPAVEAHAGRHSFGIRHEGRWMVYYHPGDLNDPWKASAFQEYNPDVQRAAMQLGINILYYAFNQWDAAVGRARR